MESLNVLGRMATVLAASTVGLIGGSLIHYVFLEDAIILRGSPTSFRKGSILFILSIILFLLAVWVLYLNRFPAILVSFMGMFISKFVWSIADGFRYAGRIYSALQSLNGDSAALRGFLDQADSYRQVQDLRSVARATFVSGSPQLKQLEMTISETLGLDGPEI